jgi:septum formation protein
VPPYSELLLASASPRRRALLAEITSDFRVEAARGIDEAALLAAAYSDYDRAPVGPKPLERLAIAKGGELAARYPQALVLSADTEVYVDEQIEGWVGEISDRPPEAFAVYRHHLGKPADREAAIAMLMLLSGRWQSIDTAIALQCQATGLLLYGTGRTLLRFRELRLDEVTKYVDAEQPYDKAGGYAVQEIGDQFVTAIRGEYSNVVGLPLELTRKLLTEAGWLMANGKGHID